MDEQEELDGVIEAGVGAVLAATALAVLGTILGQNFEGEADSFARIAWTVWAGVVAGWVALILFDYWIPVKVEPEVLQGLPDSVRNLPLDSDPLDPPIV